MLIGGHAKIGYDTKISNKHTEKKIFIKLPGIEHAKDKVNPLLPRAVPVQKKKQNIFKKILWLFFHPLNHCVELLFFL